MVFSGGLNPIECQAKIGDRSGHVTGICLPDLKFGKLNRARRTNLESARAHYIYIYIKKR